MKDSDIPIKETERLSSCTSLEYLPWKSDIL